MVKGPGSLSARLPATLAAAVATLLLGAAPPPEPPGGLELAERLNQQGNVAERRGELERAEELYRASLEIRRRLAPGGPELRGSLNNLGVVMLKRGELERAEELLGQALEIQEKLDPDDLLVAAVVNNLAIISTRRGELDRAEERFRRVLEIRQRLLPGSLEVASALNNLGVVSLERGDLEAAEGTYRRALAIKEKLDPGGASVVPSLLNLGNVLRRRGDLDGAAECYRRAVALERRHAPEGLSLAANLTALGGLTRELGDLDAARRLLEEAAAIAARRAPASYEHAVALQNLGEMALDLGDLDAAAEVLERALAVKEELAPGGVSTAVTVRTLAEVAAAGGELELAATRYRRALELLAEVAPGTLDEAEACFGLAAVELRRGRRTEALELRRRAVVALEAQSRRLGGSHDLRTRFAARYADFYHGYLELLLDAGREEEAFDLLERYRARAFLALLAERGDLVTLANPEPLERARVRAVLDPGTLLLSYAAGPWGSALFTLGPGTDDFAVHRLGVSADELERQVHRLRRGIEELVEPAALDLLRARLADTLLAPAAAEIARAERLLILPDGPLHLLPFAVLADPSSGDGRHLIEAVPVTVAASATVYAELAARRREPRSPTVVAFGDPAYGSATSATAGDGARREPTLEPLPATRREVERLRALFPESTRLHLGADATEERVEELGPGVSILHFACHGLLDPRAPLDSALALSSPAEPSSAEEDGRLQAWEVLEELRLDADLVTLSACRSGLGETRGGEGLIGLTRAFQVAGARSVLASLWSVSDRSTAALMGRFYRHLKAGAGKDEALRRAQLELLRAPIGAGDGDDGEGFDASHPFYWAGFQLFGDRL